MGKDTIKELTTREKAREKLPIFFGSRDNYYHGVREVLNNAVDEIKNNFDEGVVNIVLKEDGKTIHIGDSGRGMPIEGFTDGQPNYELLFETLFAGTNYDNSKNGKITSGTNGVGDTVLMFTSDYLSVESYRGDKKYILTYQKGGSIRSDLVSEDLPESVHGTSITFRLDPTMYSNTNFKDEDLLFIIDHIAATAQHVTFDYYSEKTQIRKKINYASLEDYFTEHATALTSKLVIGKPMKFDEKHEINTVSLVLATSSEPIGESFLNYNYLPKCGTILDGVYNGLKLALSKYARDTKLFPKKTISFSTDDIINSFSICVSVNGNNMEFANQTKFATDKKLYKEITKKYVEILLAAYTQENPQQMQKMAKHVLLVQKTNGVAKRAQQNLKKKLSESIEGIGNYVGDLKDCDIHGEDAEIFIAEGKSALGSVVLARDSKYQAAMPIRGKILNCLKADNTTIYKNKVISDLIKVLGCGIEVKHRSTGFNNFNIENLRFGKIIITTDADPDGFQIACLIITMIYKLMPELIMQHKVYIAQTPLYEVKFSDDTVIYFRSEEEKDKELSKITKKYVIERCKGLGELQPDTLAETTMNPETRNLVMVDADDAEAMDKAIEVWMGTEVETRKKIIANTIGNYADDID
jgi:DNA gyrase subunit B